MDENLINTIIQKTATATANSIYRKLREEREREKENMFDKRRYNTKLLLEHYRLFKEHAEYSIFDVSTFDEEQMNVIDILDSMLQTAVGKGEIAVESIKNSAMRTNIILNHINAMLEVYEAMCHNACKPEAERKWDALNTIYIKPFPEGMTKMDLYEDLAERYFVSDRQIRRDIEDAIISLTALMFGVDGISRNERRRKNYEKDVACEDE